MNKEYYNHLKADLFDDITHFSEYFESSKREKLEMMTKAKKYSLLLKAMNELAKKGTEQRTIFDYIKRRVQETFRNSKP